jgi:glutamate dehydrogenase
MVERSALWLLRNRPAPVDIQATVDFFSNGISRLSATLRRCLVGSFAQSVDSSQEMFVANGVAHGLSARAALWPLLHTSLDIIELASAHMIDVIDSAKCYWHVFDQLDLLWLWDQIGQLPRTTRWHNQARAALRDDLLLQMRSLTDSALSCSTTDRDWVDVHTKSLERICATFTEIRAQATYDVATLTVALHQLKSLANEHLY